MNFFGIGQSAEVEIVFDGAETRKMAEVKTEDGKKEKYPLYYDGETVSGRVNVTLKKPGSKLEHHGIRIELIGQIELYYDRGNHHEFQSLVRELARPGDLIQNTSYPFEFLNVEKPYEVYVGANVRLRYFLRVTIARRMSDIVREVDIAVHTLCSYPEINSPIKMEVGIEDCLHIEFEYNKSKYHLKDVTVGKIYFLLVRIKIKHMEIAIIKRETTGSGPNTFTENETIAKYEIMDGAPVKGESIPIRVFLAGYDLTPTMRDVNKKFSVRYYLNLVLMDTEDRRYFKQQEITLWRKADPDRKAGGLATGSSSSVAVNNPHVPSHLVGADGEIIAKGPGQSTQSAMSGGQQPLGDPLGRRQGTDEEEDEDLGEAQPLQGGGAGATGSQAASLFTQEQSPQQESKPLIRSGAPAPPPLQAADSQDEPLFPAVPSQPLNMQRGAGDGAAQTIDSAAPELTTATAGGLVPPPTVANSGSSPAAAKAQTTTNTTTEAIIESSAAGITATSPAATNPALFDENSALLKAALSNQVADDDLVDPAAADTTTTTDDIDSRVRTEAKKASSKRQAVAVPE